MRKSIILTLALVATNTAFAASLTEELKKVWETNPAILSGRENLKATEEKLSQANAGFRPVIAVSGEVTTNRVEVIDFDTKNDYDPWTASVSIQQPLFEGFKTVNQRSAAKHGITAEQSLLKNTEQQTFINASDSYMQVYSSAEVLKLNQTNEETLNYHLRIFKQRFSLGDMTKTGVSQAEARAQGATASRIAAESSYKNSLENYKKYFGEKPSSIQEVDIHYLDAQLPTNVDEAINLAADNNPNLIAAKEALNAAQKNIKIAQADHWPSVSLFATAQRGKDFNSATNGMIETEALVAGGKLTFPIYSAGITSSRSDEAKALYRKAQYDYDNAKRSVVEGVTAAWNGLRAAESTIAATEAQVTAAKNALDGVHQELELGAVSVLDALDTEQALLDARVNLIKAKNAYMSATYNLLALIGKLTPEVLGLI